MSRGTLVLLLLVACTGSADPELAGDQAYAAGQFALAHSDYARALQSRSGGRLLAKDANAALRAGDRTVAADAYARLGAEDPTRVDEAADGLDAVAHAADQAADRAALERSVLALRRLAPARTVLRYAGAVGRDTALRPADALAILPAALAAADDPRSVDTLAVRYGAALAATAACDDAASAFRTVLRRSADSGLRHVATGGLATCSLRLAIAAQSAGRPADAERWFLSATIGDLSSWTARRALIGVADARRELGDTLGAVTALLRARTLGPDDSLSRLAADRLQALAAPQSTGDSARVSPP